MSMMELTEAVSFQFVLSTNNVYTPVMLRIRIYLTGRIPIFFFKWLAGSKFHTKLLKIAFFIVKFFFKVGSGSVFFILFLRDRSFSDRIRNTAQISIENISSKFYTILLNTAFFWWNIVSFQMWDPVLLEVWSGFGLCQTGFVTLLKTTF